MEVYRLEPGDVLLSEASGSPGEVGKPALWSGEIEDCAFQNTLLRIRARAAEPRYLLHYFRFVAMTGGFTTHARGVGIHHLGRARLAGWQIPLPSLSEQRWIVDILEDHLSRLDAADDYLAAARRRLDVMLSSVLLDLIPDVSAYPDSWDGATVDAAGRIELGRQRHPDWHNGPNMKPYLRVANVFEDRIDTRDVKQMHWPEHTFERFKLQPGDVLLNEGQTPELLERPAIYRGHPPEVAFTNSLLRFKAHDDVLPEFALLVFRRHMRAGRFKRESRITTNIAHLSAARLKSVEFPIPPRYEQKRIVAVADDRLTAVERLVTELSAARAARANLRRALLAAAFSGRLAGAESDLSQVEEMIGS
jgi:type I restriction enzyme S subunit